jgi:hypothetical protein
MKIADMKAPRLRAPAGHGEAVPCFLKMLPVVDPPRGYPFWGSGIHRIEFVMLRTIQKSHLFYARYHENF